MDAAQPSRERIDVAQLPNGWTVAGQLDALTAGRLSDAFKDVPAANPVEVDLARVTFIDSSGLRVLLGLADRVAGAGGTVVIRNASKSVTRLLAITKLESTFGLSVTDPDAPSE